MGTRGPAPTTLFSVCGETLALPPVDDDDAWIDWRRERDGTHPDDDDSYHDDDSDNDDDDDDSYHDDDANGRVHPARSFLEWRRDNGFPSFDDRACSFEPLLRCLDERNAVRAVCAVALERRVLRGRRPTRCSSRRAARSRERFDR